MGEGNCIRCNGSLALFLPRILSLAQQTKDTNEKARLSPVFKKQEVAIARETALTSISIYHKIFKAANLFSPTQGSR
jgi:hypothetical protein